MTGLDAVTAIFGTNEGRALPVLPDVARGTGKRNPNDCVGLSLLASVASTFHKNRKIDQIEDGESFSKSLATLARRAVTIMRGRARWKMRRRHNPFNEVCAKMKTVRLSAPSFIEQ